ncbi:unnamed protein product [Rhizophagus irregularis]|nr:unnamed protein product [Rhizophagus irregularis]
MKNNRDMMKKLDMVYGMGKEFRSYCIDCEKEELDITDSELNYKDDDNDMEVVNEILQEESSSNESGTNAEGENKDEESTEEEEIVENETEAFEKLLEDLSTPVVEEQLREEESTEQYDIGKIVY